LTNNDSCMRRITGTVMRNIGEGLGWNYITLEQYLPSGVHLVHLLILYLVQ